LPKGRWRCQDGKGRFRGPRRHRQGNDQVRFELTYYHFNPAITIIAPWRTWNLNSRQALLDYAKKNGIPVPVTKKRPWSSDRNLLHISFEGGILEDPYAEAPEEMYVLTKSPEKAPNKPQYVEIEFRHGNPVAVDGEKMSPALLLAHLNFLGGQHGIGRVDLMENRYVGMKSRGVYETRAILVRPAGWGRSAWTARHTHQNSLIPIVRKWLHGYWFVPEREMLQTMITVANQQHGQVKLQRGSTAPSAANRNRFPVQRIPHSNQTKCQPDAEGFIRLNALRLRIRSLMQKDKK
jgi:argininosuccinate synthase